MGECTIAQFARSGNLQWDTPVGIAHFTPDGNSGLQFKNVRILEGGKKIASKEEDFYDKDILTALNKEPQKLNKLLHNILSKMKVQTGDVFLVWRINELAKQMKLEVVGDWNKGWKEIVVIPFGAKVEVVEEV